MNRLFKGFCMSLGMFTTFPFVGTIWDERSVPFVIPFLSLVGAAIGVVWSIASYFLFLSPIQSIIKAFLLMIIPLLLCGLIHLDGFMDTTDAVLSRRTLQEKKRILKDPHTGAFSVISIVLLFFAQFVSFYVLVELKKAPIVLLIAIPLFSRVLISTALLAMPSMSEEGLGNMMKAGTTHLSYFIIAVTALIGILFVFFFGEIVYWLPIAIMSGFGIFFIKYLYRQFGGISGDLCGCTLVLSETVAWLSVAILIGGKI